MVAALYPFSDRQRFSLVRVETPGADFAEDVRRGLTAERKWLPPRWFYDELGSALFDAICSLPEYYVTRAETEVLTGNRWEIAAALGEMTRLVELGSGSARKTRILLDALAPRHHQFEYMPVDVDASMLERSGRDLLSEYPQLRIRAVCADFTRPAEAVSQGAGRTVVLFLGSTIGNLDPEAAIAMLKDLRSALAPGDALLLGVDRRKEKAILEPAYDDALGVTAAFNLNLLGRINRELGGHFELQTFAHHAHYDETLGRIEMHLLSRVAQTVRIDALDLEVGFAAGESIHTESSYKHDEGTLSALASGSGFTIARTWTDSRRWFTDALMIAS